MLLEGVALGGLGELAGEDGEPDAELLAQLVLPLLDQATGGDDEAAFHVGAHHQLADEEPGHDGLAGAGVVRQHVAQRLARQHGLVDGGDLVRQRCHVGGVHRHHRVEQIGQVDAVGLGGELEVLAGGVEGPGPARLDQAQIRLVVAEEHPLGDRTLADLVVDGEGVLADRLDLDNGGCAVRREPVEYGSDRYRFQLDHRDVTLFPLRTRPAWTAVQGPGGIEAPRGFRGCSAFLHRSPHSPGTTRLRFALLGAQRWNVDHGQSPAKVTWPCFTGLKWT